jgi:hypothetical protein
MLLCWTLGFGAVHGLGLMGDRAWGAITSHSIGDACRVVAQTD